MSILKSVEFRTFRNDRLQISIFHLSQNEFPHLRDVQDPDIQSQLKEEIQDDDSWVFLVKQLVCYDQTFQNEKDSVECVVLIGQSNHLGTFLRQGLMQSRIVFELVSLMILANINYWFRWSRDNTRYEVTCNQGKGSDEKQEDKKMQHYGNIVLLSLCVRRVAIGPVT